MRLRGYEVLLPKLGFEYRFLLFALRFFRWYHSGMRRVEGDPMVDIPLNMIRIQEGMIERGAFAHWRWKSATNGRYYITSDEDTVPSNAVEREFIPDGHVVEDLPKAQIVHTDERETIIIEGLPCKYIKKPILE